MPSQEIHLRGKAAEQAQHLVARFAAEGIPVTVLDDGSNQDRGILTDILVAFGVQAAYDAVKAIVEKWLDERGLDQSDATLIPGDQDGPNADN
jgi:hypothetical protein